MRTVVEINVRWKPGDDESAWQMSKGPPAFRDLLETKLARLNSAISDETRRPIDWPANPGFKDNDDPVYRQLLDKIARLFLGQILREMDGELDALVLVPENLLQHDPRNYLRRLRPCDHKVMAMASEQVCEYCGRNCHKVNGTVYTTCPPPSGESALMLYAMAGETPVEYGVEIEL